MRLKIKVQKNMSKKLNNVIKDDLKKIKKTRLKSDNLNPKPKAKEKLKTESVNEPVVDAKKELTGNVYDEVKDRESLPKESVYPDKTPDKPKLNDNLYQKPE
jgi:hypothetical protein